MHWLTVHTVVSTKQGWILLFLLLKCDNFVSFTANGNHWSSLCILVSAGPSCVPQQNHVKWVFMLFLLYLTLEMIQLLSNYTTLYNIMNTLLLENNSIVWFTFRPHWCIQNLLSHSFDKNESMLIMHFVYWSCGKIYSVASEGQNFKQNKNTLHWTSSFHPHT